MTAMAVPAPSRPLLMARAQRPPRERIFFSSSTTPYLKSKATFLLVRDRPTRILFEGSRTGFTYASRGLNRFRYMPVSLRIVIRALAIRHWLHGHFMPAPAALSTSWTFPASSHFTRPQPIAIRHSSLIVRLIPGSSAVEQPAVNRLVAGSNPARGATSARNHSFGGCGLAQFCRRRS